MSTNKEREEIYVDQNEGENVSGATRARGEPRNGQDCVSISKPLKSSGQIRAALMSGKIDLDRIEECCVEGLNATRSFVTKERGLVSEADHATRLKYLEFITHTIEGLPIKRQETIHRKVSTNEDLIAQAKKSPAFAKALAETLSEIIELSKKGGTKKAALKVDET